MKVAYDNCATTVKELVDEWKRWGTIAYAKPYNRYEAERGREWWGIASPDWPAFQHAKIVASSHPEVVIPGQLFVGFYIEKGLEGAAGSTHYYPHSWIMDASWRWHGFSRDVLAGSFGQAVATVAQHMGASAELRLFAQVPVKPGMPRPPREQLAFKSGNGSDLVLTRHDVNTEQTLFGRASTSVTVEQLGNELQAIPRRDWVWIDVCVGYAFDSAGLHDPESLDVRQLWDRLIDPFVHWLE